MSLLQIKRGILDKDWELVVAGYEAITGEQLTVEEEVIEEAPKKKRGRPRKVVQEVQDEEDVPVITSSRKKTLVHAGSRTGKPTRTNLFVDNLSEETRYLQGKNKPPARRGNDRPKFEKIPINCSKCGKEKMESEAIINLSMQGIGKYICSKCIRGGIA